MADISRLARLINGVVRSVELANNTLVTTSIKVGGASSNTELTKSILDNLIVLQGGGDAGLLHNHDGAYYTKSQVDSEVQELASQISSISADIEEQISAEATARQAADTALQGEIDAEESARIAADAALQAEIDAEESARQAADASLASDIATEASARQAADTELAADIAAEETRAVAAEGALDTKIDQEISNRTFADEALQAEVDAVESSLASEVTAREAADTALQSSIDSAYSEFDSRLDALEADPVTKSYVDAADAALQAEVEVVEADLATEVAARISGDAATLASANSYTDQKVADLVNSAPATLDTLKELADALDSDPNFAATIAGQIGDLDTRLDSLETDPVTKTYVDEVVATKLDIQDSMVAGEAISQGDLVTVMSDGAGNAKAYKASAASADNTDLDVDGRWEVMGIALNSGASGATIQVMKYGKIMASFTGTVSSSDIGKSVFLSTTKGKVALSSPAGDGDVVVYVGRLVSASEVEFHGATLRAVN